MEWFDKSFAGLTTDELFRIYQLRAQVFNGEQESSYPDPDEQDRTARHLFCCDGSRVVAYARYFRAGKQVSFGRVVIQREYRGTGLSQGWKSSSTPSTTFRATTQSMVSRRPGTPLPKPAENTLR